MPCWDRMRLTITRRSRFSPRAETVEAEPLRCPKPTSASTRTLVLIPVTVTDPLNRFVTGPGAGELQALRRQESSRRSCSFRARTRRFPIGVVFDCSGSMGNKLDKSRQAVAQFFKTANPEDEFFLVQFNDPPELVQPFTQQSRKRSRTG